MAYRYKNKTCASCLHKQEVLEYYEDQEQGDYNSFLHYANFELEVCENCGYTSSDIEQNAQELKNVQNTKEYLNAKNFGYIDKNLVEKYDYIFESYNPNEYEAYAIHQKQNGNTGEYVRAMFSSVMQTKAMIGMLEHELTIEGDDLDEEEILDYKNIQAKLQEEMINKCQKIVEANYKNSINDQIIYVISAKKAQDDKLFDSEYKKIKSKLSEKLQQFILEY